MQDARYRIWLDLKHMMKLLYFSFVGIKVEGVPMCDQLYGWPTENLFED